MTHQERAEYIRRRLVLEFQLVDNTAREAKDKAWLEEIASHGGWATDVLFIRCAAHRNQPQRNRKEIRGGECGYCAWEEGYAQGRKEGSEEVASS